MIDPASVAKYEPADDVVDLDTARRVITALRTMMAESAQNNEPIDGEYTIFLGAEHVRKLQLLYDQGKLNYLPIDDDFGNAEMHEAEFGELEEALSEFVERAIDFQWDVVQHEDNPPSNDTVISA